jgi:hypothetical protein
MASSIEGILVFAVFFIFDPCWTKLHRDMRSNAAFKKQLPLSPIAKPKIPKLTLEIASLDTTVGDSPSLSAYI